MFNRHSVILSKLGVVILSKQILIDNTDGAKYLRISSTPWINFSTTITNVRITNTNAPDIKYLFDEFLSTTQIHQMNQPHSYCFLVPIKPFKLSIDITIVSDSIGVDDFYVEKVFE